MLIHLYSSYIDSNNSNNAAKNKKLANEGSSRSYSDRPMSNGHARAPNTGSGAERQLRDEQEFELEALMSDDDEDVPLKQNGRP